MSEPIPGKSSWPELVGVLAKLAATTIAHDRDRPDVFIEVLPPGSPIIPPEDPNYNPMRVRVFINSNGIVNQVPVIG